MMEHIDREAAHYLASGAALASACMMDAEATKMVDALVLARPEEPNALMIAATLQMVGGRPEQAKDTLRSKVLKADPDNIEAKALLALVHDTAEETAARDALLREGSDSGAEASLVEMAKTRLVA